MSTLITISDENTVIPVIGGNLMGEQLIGFMKQALDDLGLMNQITSVMIREENDLRNIDEAGSILRALYDPLTKSILISIGEIWVKALTEAEREERKALSLRGVCHFAFCEAFLHECYHCQSHGAKGEDWIHDGEEEDAEEFSINWLCDMAKTYNLELPPVEEDGWFGSQTTDWIEMVKDKDERMLKMQVDMHEKNIVWRDLYEDIDYTRMNDFYRIIAVDAMDDKAWGSTKSDLVVPVKPPDVEATKIPVPPPPSTPSSPIDDFESDEPVASFMDDEENWDDIPWGDEEINSTPTIAKTLQKAADTAKAVEKTKAAKPSPMDPKAGPLQVPTIPVAEQSAIAKKVIRRLFDHMFNKCGWTGATWDQSLVGSVREPVLVDDVANVRQVFTGMNAEVDGKFRRNVKIKDRIIGDVQLRGTPKYELFMNANGKRVKRVIVPVNMKTQSASTQEMKDGKLIAWLMDGYKPATEDSILFRLSYDPEHDTEVEWTEWPIEP